MYGLTGWKESFHWEFWRKYFLYSNCPGKTSAQIDLWFAVRPTENLAKDPFFQLPSGPGLLINPSVLWLGALGPVLVVKLKVYMTVIVSRAYNVSNRFLENVLKFQQFFDLKNGKNQKRYNRAIFW